MSKKNDFTVSLKLSESNTLPDLAELISSTLKMEAICSSESHLKLNGLNGVIFQKTLLLAGFG
jgi:hypothetical protein